MDDRLVGPPQEFGSFMALLNEDPPAQTTQHQRLGSLAALGPGERGGRALPCWGRRQQLPGRRKFKCVSCRAQLRACLHLSWPSLQVAVMQPELHACLSRPARLVPAVSIAHLRSARRSDVFFNLPALPAGTAAATLTPAVQQTQQYAAYPGGFPGPTGGIPQQLQQTAAASLGYVQQQPQQQPQQQQLVSMLGSGMGVAPPAYALAGSMGTQVG